MTIPSTDCPLPAATTHSGKAGNRLLEGKGLVPGRLSQDQSPASSRPFSPGSPSAGWSSEHRSPSRLLFPHEVVKISIEDPLPPLTCSHHWDWLETCISEAGNSRGVATALLLFSSPASFCLTGGGRLPRPRQEAACRWDPGLALPLGGETLPGLPGVC